MIRYACGIAVAICLFAEVPSGWSQQYLYSPTVVGGEGNTRGSDGVLVQDVSVQKGDTLYAISRKFSGHGSYYPQILLFNDIKNPNLIYPGNVFKVPVSRHTVPVQSDAPQVRNEKGAEVGGQAAVASGVDSPAAQKPVTVVPSVTPVADLSAHDHKKADVGREKKRTSREKTAAAKKQAAAEKHHAAAAATGDLSAGQKLFERAVKAYRQEDCKTALELFDRYLAENPASPLAADASLYKAECYLKLSAQN